MAKAEFVQRHEGMSMELSMDCFIFNPPEAPRAGILHSFELLGNLKKKYNIFPRRGFNHREEKITLSKTGIAFLHFEHDLTHKTSKKKLSCQQRQKSVFPKEHHNNT